MSWGFVASGLCKFNQLSISNQAQKSIQKKIYAYFYLKCLWQTRRSILKNRLIGENNKNQRNMKRTLNYLLTIPALFALAITISCEGPEGPVGQDGQNASEVCKECHNDEKQDSVSTQYASSVHAAGANVGYAGGRNDCAACHSHEGFVETQHTGRDTTAADIPIPTAIACNTCHDDHNTLDFENDGPDYAMRTKEAVTLLMDGSSLDFEGSSNLCASCHQPRTPAPSSTDGTYAITSPHYGPHHGTQATVLEGIGGYELAGSMSYPEPGASTHRTGASCNSCHMSPAADNNSTGGHTFVPNLASCTSCHTDASSFDVNGVQTEVESMLGDLETALINANIIGTDGHLLDDSGEALNYGSSLNLTIDQAGAYFNWATVAEDRSMGVHNPAYVKALLQNSIEVFN